MQDARSCLFKSTLLGIPTKRQVEPQSLALGLVNLRPKPFLRSCVTGGFPGVSRHADEKQARDDYERLQFFGLNGHLGQVEKWRLGDLWSGVVCFFLLFADWFHELKSFWHHKNGMQNRTGPPRVLMGLGFVQQIQFEKKCVGQQYVYFGVLPGRFIPDPPTDMNECGQIPHSAN